MRKKGKRRIRKSVPMVLISRKDMEIKEHMAVKAFTNGYATEAQYDAILQAMNMLLIAGRTDTSRKYVADFCTEHIQPALIGIKTRFLETGKFGVNAEQNDAIKRLMEVSRQFWIRQTEDVYNFTIDQLNQFYEDINKRRSA